MLASQSDFLEKLPFFKCNGETCMFNRTECQGSSKGILDKAVMDAYVRRGNECKDGTSFGGALVLDGIVTFQGGSMSEVDLTTPTPQMNELFEAIQLRFDIPSSIDSTPVKTRAGVEYPNWLKTWKIGRDVLVLDMRFGKINEGRVLLVTGERLSTIEAISKSGFNLALRISSPTNSEDI